MSRYEAGRVIDDRYEVLSSLGQGGLNETFKALDRQTERTVVLKMPNPTLIGDPATFTRYKREMEIGKLLDHPNIQRLLAEGCLESGLPYMVLEYVEGSNLRAYLTEHAPLPIPEAITVAVQIADALQYCHERSVIHRDLKPENVLIQNDGHVKLMDFGIALLRGARRLTFTHFSNAVGTPDYMAPEQVRGERGGARTDVFALGVMLYEMLASEVPYQGESPLAVMSQRVSNDAELITTRRPEVPAGLEAVLFRALRREPAERYQSLAEFRYGLENLDSVPIPDYTTQSRRGPLPSLLPAIAIILMVIAALAALGILAQIIHNVQIAR